MGTTTGPEGRTAEHHLTRWRRDGNPADLAALFDLLAPDLFRLALHLCRDAATAEDVLQETFLAVMEHADAWDPSRPARPWLASILRHRASKSRRAAARSPDPRRAPGPAPEADPLDVAAGSEERERLHHAMLELPEPYRGVALLRWRYGLEPAEIAEVKGVPPGTVWSWLHRAVARLREGMGALPALVIGFRSERGLDGVRRALVRRAGLRTAAVTAATAAAVGGTGGAVTAAGGFLVGKQAMVAGVVLLLLGATGWVVLRGGNGDSPGAGTAARRDEVAAVPEAPTVSPVPPEQDPDPTAVGVATASSPPPVDLDACDRDLDLFGVVVDGNDAPVAGARIEAFRQPLAAVYGLPAALRSRREDGPSTTSSTDGSFALRLHRGARVDLRVDAPPFAELTLQDRSAGARLRIVLRPGTTLRLSVKDDDGAPVAGASVHLLRPKELPLPLVDRRGVTGDDGVCVVDRLTGGVAVLDVTSPGTGRSRPEVVRIVESGSQDVDVVLPRRTVVRGEVVDGETGVPVPGASVSWSPFGGPRGVTDGDGRFSLPGWSGDDSDTVFAEAEGRNMARAVVAADATVVVRLDRSTVLLGRVLDVAGHPLAGASVLLTGSDAADATESAEDGGFRLAGNLREGRTVLRIAADGFGAVLRKLPAAGTPEVDLGEIRLGPARTIEGRVIDVDGAPVEGAPVVVERATAEVWTPRELREIAWTDDLGRFRFTGRSSGTWRVAILPGGPAAPLEGSVEVAPDRDPDPLVLRPVASRDVTITVRDDEGRPAAGIGVGIRSGGPEAMRMQRTGDDGVARMRSIPREPCQVQVSDLASPPRWLRTDASLAADADVLEVVLARVASSLAGRVVGPAGEPVAGLWIEALPAGDGGGQPSGGATTGVDGSFRIDLPTGTRVDLRISPQAALLAKSPYRGELRGCEAPAGDLILRARKVAADRSLRVTILDHDDTPLPDIHLYVLPGGRPRVARTGADGTAEFGELTGDPLDVMVNPGVEGAFWRTHVAPPVLHVAGGEGPVTLRFRAGVPMRGTVVDGDGRPETGGMVQAVFEDGSRSVAKVDGEGRFVVAVIPGAVVKRIETRRNDENGRPLATASLADLPPGSDDVVLRFGE